MQTERDQRPASAHLRQSELSMYNTHFRCIRGCHEQHAVSKPIYRCPSCGGLLEVAHDLDALRAKSADAWKSTFASRLSSVGTDLDAHGSGVWAHHEWVMPWVRKDSIVSTGEGRTTLLFAKRAGEGIGVPQLFVKQCGTSHTGSFKDLGMTVLTSVVNQAKKDGLLDVRAICCASTGDTSAALAAYGAIAGLPVAVLLPKGLVSTAQLVQPLAHGAKVLALDTDFDGCMKIVSALAEKGIVYLANSMNALRIEGQKTVAFEIIEQLGWEVPDWVVLPSGNLGNASALYAGFAMMKALGVTSRLPRLLVAQAAAANPMVTAYRAKSKVIEPMKAQPTVATAIRIGAPVSAERAMRALTEMNGVAEDATEAELASAAARADRAGLYTCPQTAVALAVLEKARARGDVKESDRVVVVSTAHGLKFTEMKVAHAAQPIEVSADVAAVEKLIG
jgi:threonine synthase